MKRKVTYAVIAALTAIALVIIAILLINNSNKNTGVSGKLKIEDFNSQDTCLALMPSCGYCPGEELDGNCYVTQAEYDTYKSQYDDLKSTN